MLLTGRFTLVCPETELFVQGVDILTAMSILADQPMAFLCTDEEYSRRARETLEQAAQAVTT